MLKRAVKEEVPVEIPDAPLGAELPEVLRVASALYAQDRAQIERAARRQELKQAAAEAGLPPEYLERAAVALQAQRSARRQQRRRRRGFWAMGTATAAALFAIGGMMSHTPVPPPEAYLTPPGMPAAMASPAIPIPTFARPPHYYGPYGGPDMRGWQLAGRSFAGQDLSKAYLRGAVLTHANLRGTDLRGADLSGADLTGADLAGAELDGAKYDRNTRWPVGFSPGDHGARSSR